MRKLLFIVCLLCTFTLKAQHFNSQNTLQSLFYSDSNSLYLNIDNYNFLWNNEFFNPIIDGYTLIGYNINPAIEYHFTPNFKAKAGVYAQKYSGLDKFTRTVPTYSVTWHKNNFAMIAGTINGTSFHRLPDMMWHQELQLTNAHEDGFQMVFNNQHIFADAWVNWKSFIFAGDKKQEELFGGLSVDPVVLANNNSMLKTPVSFLIFHQGGQIDSVDRSLKTLLNYSAGLNLTKNISSAFIKTLSLESRLIGYYDNSPNPQSLYNSGWGNITSIKATRGDTYLSAGYWYGSKFLSMAGNPIYSCFSTISAQNHRKTRQLIVGELHVGKQIVQYFNLSAVVNGYFDIELSRFDYTYGVVMALYPRFFIKRFKQPVPIN